MSSITDIQQYKKLPHRKTTHITHYKYKIVSLTVDKFTQCEIKRTVH